MRIKGQMLFALVVVSLVVLLATLYQSAEPEKKEPVPFLQVSPVWADSVLQGLSLSDKLGQILMAEVAADEAPDSNLSAVGGIKFNGHAPTVVHQFAWQIKRQQPIPPLLGLGIRKHEDWIHLPNGEALAAISQKDILAEATMVFARQAKDAGIHTIFLEQSNEIYRPENRQGIVDNLLSVASTLQAEGLVAVPNKAAAYFPLVRDSIRRDSLMWPYRRMASKGLSGLWVSNASIERIKWHSERRDIIKQYLLDHGQFEGLMYARLSTEEAERKDRLHQIIKSGADVVIVPQHQLSDTKKDLIRLYNEGVIRSTTLNDRVRRILLAKSWTQAPEAQALAMAQDSLQPLPDRPADKLLARRLTQASIISLRNTLKRLPIDNLQVKKIHLLSIGDSLPILRDQLRQYAPVEESFLFAEAGKALPAVPIEQLRQFQPVLVSIESAQWTAAQHDAFVASLQELQTKTQVILVNHGSTASLAPYAWLPTIVHAFEDDPLSQQLLGQAIMGGVSPQGRMPLALGPDLAFGRRDSLPLMRIAYAEPEAVGLSSQVLTYIDSIVAEGIDEHAMPGCQVLVAKSGSVIYQKAFGYHTYLKKRPTELTDLYDIASVTKVAATTVAAMKMADEGRISLVQPIERYFRQTTIELDSSSKQDSLLVHADSLQKWIVADSSESNPYRLVAQREGGVRSKLDTFHRGDSVLLVKTSFIGKRRVKSPLSELKLRELLTHRSGLPKGLPIFPFLRYRNSQKGIGKYDRYYHPRPDSQYNITVARNFHLRNDYWDTLWTKTLSTVPSPEKAYEYSDANIILVQQAIDSVNEESISDYLIREVYGPLGLQQICYNPRENVSIERIVPTENDLRWRGQLLRGYVHDPTAALLGGVSGNAGLFSNANDLAILFQMILNGGSYGGQQYFRPKTVKEFTRRQGGHRGYGFDKPPAQGANYIIAPSATTESYGHTGFTGTCVWVDPAHDLIFVFLSNRVHPRANNWKLNQLQIRQRIHEVVYQAMEKTTKP
ncbi:MAG: serine hydrolase [Bacteroidota bacterium]